MTDIKPSEKAEWRNKEDPELRARVVAYESAHVFGFTIHDSIGGWEPFGVYYREFLKEFTHITPCGAEVVE